MYVCVLFLVVQGTPMVVWLLMMWRREGEEGGRTSFEFFGGGEWTCVPILLSGFTICGKPYFLKTQRKHHEKDTGINLNEVEDSVSVHWFASFETSSWPRGSSRRPTTSFPPYLSKPTLSLSLAWLGIKIRSWDATKWQSFSNRKRRCPKSIICLYKICLNWREEEPKGIPPARAGEPPPQTRKRGRTKKKYLGHAVSHETGKINIAKKPKQCTIYYM